MKKKFFGIIILSTMIVGGIFVGLPTINNSNASNSVINPDCPNGCHANGKGCKCHGYHPTLREHDWNKHVLEIR